MVGGAERHGRLGPFDMIFSSNSFFSMTFPLVVIHFSSIFTAFLMDFSRLFDLVAPRARHQAGAGACGRLHGDLPDSEGPKSAGGLKRHAKNAICSLKYSYDLW